MPPAPDFVLHEDIDPAAPPDIAPALRDARDNPGAARFRTALTDQYQVIAQTRDAAKAPPKRVIDLQKLAARIVQQLDPGVTVTRWIGSGIAIPPRIRA